MDVLTRAPAILGVGAAVPKGRVTAAEIEARLGLPAGWVARRTGARELPVAAPDEATSDLAVRAGKRALAAADADPTGVGLVLLATSTPDHPLPPTAPDVATRLGATAAGAVDLAGACAGFLYALALADAHARVRNQSVLVIGANVLTRRVDPDDPVTAALFADGAGAVLVAPGRGGGDGLLAVRLEADGRGKDEILVPAGGTRIPPTPERIAAGEHLMRMERGKAVYREAVRGMVDVGRAALADAGMTASDVDLFVPHQANSRIVADAARQLGVPPEKTVDVMARFGNSSAATIPIALDAALAAGRLRRGHRVLATAVGAGLVRAATVFGY